MFKIVTCSDLDHEEIVADVCWNHDTIATVNQDKGLENLEVELFSQSGEESLKFPFDEMMEAFSEAKETLFKMQKLPD